MNMKKIFDNHNDEYLKFERVENKRSTRPDVHAFIVLSELFPRDRALISGAEHDEIYLDIAEEEVNVLTENQIVDLVRCGVRLDDEFGELCLFV